MLGKKVWVVAMNVGHHLVNDCSACEGVGNVQTLKTQQKRKCAKCDGAGHVGAGNVADYTIHEAVIVGISPKNRWLESYISDPTNFAQETHDSYFLKMDIYFPHENKWFYIDEFFVTQEQADYALEMLKMDEDNRIRKVEHTDIIAYKTTAFQRVRRDKLTKLRLS